MALEIGRTLRCAVLRQIGFSGVEVQRVIDQLADGEAAFLRPLDGDGEIGFAFRQREGA